MKLNNKGMSLIELLVSIVLVSIVLTFLFQLLLDLKDETDNNNFAYNNQVNRTEAIFTVHKDLEKYTLVGIEDNSSGNKISLIFHYNNDKKAYLSTDYKTINDETGKEITKHYLRYKNVNNEAYSWEMVGATIDPCGTFTYYIDSLSNNYYFKLNIYLYNSVYHERNNKDRNNAIDDIEISYSGSKSYLNTYNGSYITNNTIGDKQIGICSN